MPYKSITVSGAYGRDYASAEAALADWNADKDFAIRSINVRGAYVNMADAKAAYPEGSMTHVHIRYNADADIAVVDLATGQLLGADEDDLDEAVSRYLDLN
jgi:hypothetical protein